MYLNCHSYFSLRYGTFSENELLKLAESNKATYVALTDINNTSACLSFLKQAKNLNSDHTRMTRFLRLGLNQSSCRNQS